MLRRCGTIAVLQPTTTSGLSDQERREVVSAFAMFDRNGNGTIDASELRVVLRSLLEREPSDAEVHAVFSIIDKDNSGQIELSEFVNAMEKWLVEDKMKPKKYRGPNYEQQRETIHKKIKSFFSQACSGTFVETDSNASLTPQQRYEMVLQARNTMERSFTLARALTSPILGEQIEAIKAINFVLSIFDNFRAPNERVLIAELIVRVFEFIVQYSVIPLFSKMLKQTYPEVQYEIVKAITLIAPGPRIPMTQEDSPLHPDKIYFKRLIIFEEIIPTLFTLIQANLPLLTEQAITAIGTIASDHVDCRDYILTAQGLVKLLGPLQLSIQNANLPVLRQLSWTLSILCGVSHPLNRLPHISQIQVVLPALASILNLPDEEVILNACNAFAVLLPIVPESNVIRRLVELTRPHFSPRIHLASLKAITNVIRFEDLQTKFMIENGLLSNLDLLLRDSIDTNVRLQICDILLFLVGIKGYVQALISAPIMKTLLDLVNVDKDLKWKLVKLTKYATYGTAQEVCFLVKNNCIPVLCNCLLSFKQYDRVLSSVYNYYGPSFQFELIRDVLIALYNCVLVGEAISEENLKPNSIALVFDLNCLDKIKSLLLALQDALPSDLNAWRLPTIKPGVWEPSTEEIIFSLLQRIHQAHKALATEASRHISAMITQMLETFFSLRVQINNIIVKTNLKGEAVAKATELPIDISFAKLLEILQAKYQQPLILTYMDTEGDLITLEDDASWRKLIGQSQRSEGVSVVKLQLLSKNQEEPKNIEDKKSGQKHKLPDTESSSEEEKLKTKKKQKRINKESKESNKRKKEEDEEKGEEEQKSEDQPKTKKSAPNTLSPLLLRFLPTNKEEINFEKEKERLQRDEKSALLSSLESTTKFGKAELEKLYEYWKDTASKDGNLTKETFTEGLKQLGITDPLLIEQNFAAFDTNKDGAINFREFVTGLSIVQRGTPEERMQQIFRAYDVKGKGYLSSQELLAIYEASLKAKGQTVNETTLQKMVDESFKQIDTNHDGKLSFDEFYKAVQSQSLIIECFDFTSAIARN